MLSYQFIISFVLFHCMVVLNKVMVVHRLRRLPLARLERKA